MLEGRQECIHDLWRELRSPPGADLFDRFLGAERPVVGPVRRHLGPRISEAAGVPRSRELGPRLRAWTSTSSSSAPPARCRRRSERPTAILVRRGGERLLFDCAEGTQRQLLRSNVGLIELREVFLTHYHADHYLGLPGMLKTFALRGREVPITIYGPPGLDDLFGALRRIFGQLTYQYELVELQPGDDARPRRLPRSRPSRSTTASPRSATRSSRTPRPGRFDVETADALGVPRGPERGALQRGEAVTLAGRPTSSRPSSVLGAAAARAGRSSSPATRRLREPCVEAARGADLLVHEATFARGRARARATRPRHSTARRGGASSRATAGVGLLALTHLSNRYFGARDRAGGADDLPGHGRPAGLRYHRRAVPGAGFAGAREGWRHPQARPVAVERRGRRRDHRGGPR